MQPLSSNHSETQAPLPAGTRVHGLVLQQVIGRGGAGIVYAAVHEMLGETLAVKEFLPIQLARRGQAQQVEPLPGQEEMFAALRQKFLQEGQTLVALARPRPHPNIVQATDAFCANDTVYLCMRFERGEALNALIHHAGPLSEAQLLVLIPPLLDGLEHAHLRRVLHRDIKPSNILLRDEGSPVLIDFGAAHRQHADGQVSVIKQYTPDFAAPEQLMSGQQGPWTDIYCLAATFVYCLTGQAPQGTAVQLQPVGHLAKVTPTLLAALNAALCFEVKSRPQNIAQWRALLALEGSAPVDDDMTKIRVTTDLSPQLSTPSGDQTTSASFSSRWVLVGFLLLLLLLTGIAWALWAQFSPAWFSPPSSPPVRVSPAIPVMPTPPPDPLTVLKRLTARLECAQLSGTLEAAADGQARLRLQGLVRDQLAWERLAGSLTRELPNTEILATEVALAAPFCAQIAAFNAAVADAPVHPHYPLITFNHPDHRYHQDDLIAVTATQPQETAGFLYLEFIDQQGERASLLPNPVQADNFLSPGARLEIGAGTLQACDRQPDACFLASRPHGNNLVLGIWSARPLHGHQGAELLAVLRREAAAGGALRLGYQFVTTAP